MGIRIHKCLGYGLTDIKTDGKYKVIDQRFNDFNKLHDSLYECENTNSFYVLLHSKNRNILIDWLVNDFGIDRKKAEFNISTIPQLIKNKIEDYQLIKYEPEFFTNDLIIFLPIEECKQWFRCDDTLDWYHSTLENKQENKIIFLKDKGHFGGIYPYNGTISLRPGRESIKGYKTDWNLTDTTNANEYKIVLDFFERNNQPDMVKRLTEDFVPKIPETIMLFVKYFDIFKDPMTVYDLTPVYCEWWG